jgi:hypothetical protein
MVVAELGTNGSQGQALLIQLDGLRYLGWCYPLIAELDTLVSEEAQDGALA